MLANKLGDYVVRLLDKVHGNAELNAILNAGDDSSDDPCRPHGELARLQLAIDCKEKKVFKPANNNNNNNNKDDKEAQFLFQRLSIAMQRFNAILLHESFGTVVDPEL